MVQQRRYRCVSSRSFHAEQDSCASSLCASSSGSSSTDECLQQDANGFEQGCAAQQEGPNRLPVLPSEVIDQVLGTLKQSWQARPSRLAKDEVREWTQYSLVCKGWQAAFGDIHLCIEFHEASQDLTPELQ
ncbi:hypothetical protein CVIRNUC_010061 [Coccomyxa viridis]|uniref:F-box domain-containing protein n=1 Tax=Coccomyxa viridis TaxID=1274662 RepID=A0AAV1IJJ0_9CHLO|nr:hypothetical protein CVIRNUC_010061 [Coccomyxa viridis]